MSVGSIGVQTIMPKSGTSQEPPRPPANDNDDDHDAPVAAKQAPPPPGMGTLVDKTI